MVDRLGDRGRRNEARCSASAALLCAYHRRGDRGARTRVIEENLPLVHALARRFSRPSEPIDDLVQVGAIGLIKAVDGFREERGRDLGAYAVPTIVGELRRHVRNAQASRGGRPPVEALDDDALEDDARGQVDVSETRELVRVAFGALSPRERRVVALRFFGDWSQQTIAAEVGLSQVQVSRVLTASLAKMRERLEVA